MMMSTTPLSLQNRQGSHRRQNSTPVAFEAMKVQYPATVQRQISQHRRGQSYDARRPARRNPQQGSTVSIANIGSTQQGQQILREAQQQRLARPGQQPQIELPVSPQCGIYQAMSDTNLMTSPYDQMTMDAIMQNLQGMPSHSPFFPQEMNLPMSAGLTMGFDLDENNQHYFQSSNTVSLDMGVMSMNDRRMSHPDLRIHTGLRPLTPTQQIQISQLPLTPATTPFKLQTSQPLQHARSLQASPIQMYKDDEIRSPHPVSMKKSKSLQGIVEQEETNFTGSDFESADIPCPPSKVQVRPKSQLEASTTQSAAKSPSKKSIGGIDPFALEASDDEEQDLKKQPMPVLASSQTDGSMSPTRPALSPRRMSISDLNLEPGISASIEETNVTLDDIAQFIEGPDPADNKWICKYEDCNKRFGRKENIKSHVQTHLGDRQFRCDHCKKCFVRGHDLKRHAKIHTGTKPYPCLCGNAFARHDALTRHRQRGMCIGAFDGIVKKVIKRGRPRKHRPEMDERVDKAARTRYNQAGSENGMDAYASSASSCSMSSWDSPPTETMDNLSIRGQSPYDDIELFGLPHQSSHGIHETIAFPPDMFTYTPPASPGYSCGNRPSPSHYAGSVAGDISHAMVRTASQPLSVIDELPHIDTTGHLLSANPMVIQHSQQSLPGLSYSSSSPAADIAAFDFGSDDLAMDSLQVMKMGTSTKLEMIGGTHERNEFDSFLDYGGIDMGLDGSNVDPFFTM